MDGTETHDDGIELRPPAIGDGGAMWAIARDSGTLDLNSSYAYLLWCRDFAATSVVAVDRRERCAVIGYVTGYRRPAEPATLLVWQVATERSHRGRGIAGRMIDGLLARAIPDGVDHLETTITPDNQASVRLFEGAAARHRASVETSTLFDASAFPDGHEPEVLYRIGPLRMPDRTAPTAL